MDYIKKNAAIWDQHVENGYIWSVPVSAEEIENARKGVWDVVLTPQKKVPKDWFPTDLSGKKFCSWPVVEGSRGLSWRLLVQK